MNLSLGKNSFPLYAAALGAALIAFTLAADSTAAAKGAGLDVEIPFQITVLKTPEIFAPYFLAPMDGKLVVSDQAGGVYSVTLDGKATALASRAKIKHPAGVAIAPAGFGSYAGQIFVLATSGSEKSPCEVMRIDGAGKISTFVKLPASKGGMPVVCRDLEFGPAGTPFAGKLYAATSKNSTVYAIDSSGNASVFGVYRDPMPFELTTIGFTSASDPKAPNSMLVGMHLEMGKVAKVGRIAIVKPGGKMGDVYRVGFIRPSGFAWSPAGFGTYPHEFFVAETGKFFSQNNGMRDGVIDRIEKGSPRPWATGLMDPTDFKFVGNKMVICDPAERGVGGGAIVIISSMM
ncbi:MAG: hypothetical protein ACREQI_03585 [Candidatus Binataceae bacterium]